eukprot:SAG22_NODE_19813_length_271_cov_0.773256_1_plen_49_part_10
MAESIEDEGWEGRQESELELEPPAEWDPAKWRFQSHIFSGRYKPVYSSL